MGASQENCGWKLETKDPLFESLGVPVDVYTYHNICICSMISYCIIITTVLFWIVDMYKSILYNLHTLNILEYDTDTSSTCSFDHTVHLFNDSWLFLDFTEYNKPRGQDWIRVLICFGAEPNRTLPVPAREAATWLQAPRQHNKNARNCAMSGSQKEIQNDPWWQCQ